MSIQNDFGHKGQPYAGYWTNRKWFTSVSIFLLCWVVVYLFAHWDKIYTGYEYARFTTPQIQQINRILYENDMQNAEYRVANDMNNYYQQQQPQVAYDTIYKDSNRIVMSAPVMSQQKNTATVFCDDSCHLAKAMLYISSEFDNKIKPEQLTVIRQYMSSFSAQEVGLFLADLRLKVKSYFWMTGPMVYLEIVFWVIIGVACSILFALGNNHRNPNAPQVIFSEGEIPYQVAKLFYAPACTIILVLTYNYIKHRNVIEVNTNEGMIVFSFIAGLFSGRMMSLLERFKDVLLPEHTIMTPATNMPMPVQPQYNSLAAPIIPQPPVQPQAQYAPPAATQEHTATQPVAPVAAEQEAEEQIADEIGEVTINLKLDVSGLFEEEKRELLDNGFASAIVTLHNVNGKDIITVKKGDDGYSGTFLAQHVSPGIYIVRSTLTQKLSNDYIMNLFGEKTAYITHENNNIELYIKKYEAID
jgi:hypothetical protein